MKFTANDSQHKFIQTFLQESIVIESIEIYCKQIIYGNPLYLNLEINYQRFCNRNSLKTIQLKSIVNQSISWHLNDLQTEKNKTKTNKILPKNETFFFWNIIDLYTETYFYSFDLSISKNIDFLLILLEGSCLKYKYYRRNDLYLTNTYL